MKKYIFLFIWTGISAIDISILQGFCITDYVFFLRSKEYLGNKSF